MIVLNRLALSSASHGVRRYASEVLAHMDGAVEMRDLGKTGLRNLDKALGLACNVRAGETLWTPTPTGSLLARDQIVTVHDCIALAYDLKNSGSASLYMKLSRRIYSRCSCIVFISNDALRQFDQFYSLPDVNKIVIASGFPTVRPGRSEPGGAPGGHVGRCEQGRPYILSVGNHLPHKNIGALCEAYVASRLPAAGIELRIIGGLDARARAARRAAPEHIRPLPFQTDAGLKAQFAGALAYVSPSLLEGHNLTVAEALQQGTPVLASDIPVHREFYDGLCGFFDAGNREAFVEALDSLLHGALQHPARDALSKARTFRDTAEDYVELFREYQASPVAERATPRLPLPGARARGK